MYIMMTLNDIEQITNTKDKVERLINNVQHVKMSKQIGQKTFGLVCLQNYVKNIIEVIYIINIYIREVI